jgi:Ni/Fe-hydrogenase subunit HybB-like protein
MTTIALYARMRSISPWNVDTILTFAAISFAKYALKKEKIRVKCARTKSVKVKFSPSSS